MIFASMLLRELLLSSLIVTQEFCHIPFSYKPVQVPVYLDLRCRSSLVPLPCVLLFPTLPLYHLQL